MLSRQRVSAPRGREPSARSVVLLVRAHRDADRGRRAEAGVGRTITPSRSSRSKNARASLPTSAKRKFATAGPTGSRPCSRRIASSRTRPSALHRAAGARPPPDVEARERGLLRGSGDVEGAPHLADRGHDRGRREPVADPQPGEPVDLREGPQDDHPAAALEVLLDTVRVVRVVDVLEVGLVEHGQDVLRHALEVGVELGARVRRAGRVVRQADVDDLRARRRPRRAARRGRSGRRASGTVRGTAPSLRASIT